MTIRRLAILAVILGALLGIGAWLRAREQATPAGAAAVPLVPSTVTVDTVSAVELSIGQPASALVRVTREPAPGAESSAGTALGPGGASGAASADGSREPTGPSWQVPSAYGAPADVEHLRRFLEALQGLAGEERARGAAWFPVFGVGPDGVSMRVLDGDRVIAHLVVGRSQKDPTTNFVRRAEARGIESALDSRRADVATASSGEEAIYAVDTDLLGIAGLWGPISSASLTSRPWVDLRLAPLEPSAVAGVEVAEWVAGAWIVRGERYPPFDGVVNAVLGMRATDVVDPAEHAALFKPPRWRWIITATDGARLELEEAAPSAGQDAIIVRRLPDGPCFTVSGWTLTHAREGLLPKPPQPPEPPASP